VALLCQVKCYVLDVLTEKVFIVWKALKDRLKIRTILFSLPLNCGQREGEGASGRASRTFEIYQRLC